MHKEFYQRIRGTTEGAIFLTGVLLIGALLVQWIFIWIADAKVAGAIGAQVGGELISGREVGVPLGLGLGAPPILVIEYSAVQDIASVALTYPLFLFLLHKYHHSDRWLMRRIRKLEAAGQHHEKFVRKWGPVGIYLFMLVPFIFNGPLVGAMAGRIAGIRTKQLIAPVVTATVTMSIIWTMAFDEIIALASRIGITKETHPVLLAIPTLVIVILIAGLPVLLDYIRHAKDVRHEARLDEEE